MNRVLIYSQEQLRLYDLLEMAKHPLVSEGYVTADLLGLGSSNVTAGFSPTYNSNLTITFGTGRLYTLQVVDATIYGGTPGGLAADPTIIAQSAENPAQTLTFSTASLTSGQALYALVEVSYAQTDVIGSADPTSGLLTYLNPSNPLVPWIGPGNDGIPQSTTRAAQAVLTIKYGAAATSGAQVPPTVDSGNVPLYLVTLSFGQTSITSANVVVAGPSAAINVPSNYPSAPFIAGLLNSHHSGTTGQAPQIKLTSEVQGTLPLANLPATDTVGALTTIQTFAGNPNSHVAGKVQDFCWDTTNLVMYTCTTTGTASTTVWQALSLIGSNTSSGANAIMGVNGAAGSSRGLNLYTAGLNRWSIVEDNTSESGSNAGSNLVFISYNDDGSVLQSNNLTIIRATGAIVLGSSSGVPAGVTGVAGISTVMFTTPVLLTASPTIGSATTLHIGTSYPNAKIAILKINSSIIPTGAGGASRINLTPNAATDSNTNVKLYNIGPVAALLNRLSQQIFVPLTLGANPSFSYLIIEAGLTSSVYNIYLDGFIQ